MKTINFRRTKDSATGRRSFLPIHEAFLDLEPGYALEIDVPDSEETANQFRNAIGVALRTFLLRRGKRMKFATRSDEDARKVYVTRIG